MNILDAIKLPKYDPPHYFFDVNKYAPTDGYAGFGFGLLKKCIQTSAIKFSYNLFCNGCVRKKYSGIYKDFCQFKCSK